jgi:pilus assembly protein Flp/PilA
MFDLQYIVSMLKQIRKDPRGVTALEYGLIAAGVACAIITAVTTLGTDLSSKFAAIATAIGTGT